MWPSLSDCCKWGYGDCKRQNLCLGEVNANMIFILGRDIFITSPWVRYGMARGRSRETRGNLTGCMVFRVPWGTVVLKGPLWPAQVGHAVGRGASVGECCFPKEFIFAVTMQMCPLNLSKFLICLSESQWA